MSGVYQNQDNDDVGQNIIYRIIIYYNLGRIPIDLAIISVVTK